LIGIALSSQGAHAHKGRGHVLFMLYQDASVDEHEGESAGHPHLVGAAVGQAEDDA